MTRRELRTLRALFNHMNWTYGLDIFVGRWRMPDYPILARLENRGEIESRWERGRRYPRRRQYRITEDGMIRVGANPTLWERLMKWVTGV